MTNTESRPKNIPINQPQYDLAIAMGLELIASGKSKADAARAIFESISDESREVMICAFVTGATLTEKGAPTYYYNINRQFNKSKNRNQKTSQKITVKSSNPNDS